MRKTNCYLLILFMLAMPALVTADVVIKEKMNVETAGIMSMEIEGTQYVKADRSCNKAVAKMTGGMMAMMGSGATYEDIQITRLDKGVMWDLSPEKKTYTEKSLAQFKETMASGQKDTDQQAVDPDEYEWTVEVKESKDPIDINGFKCLNVIGQATGVHKEDPERKMSLLYEYWYTRKAPGYDVMTQYNKKFAEVTGVDLRVSQQAAARIFEEFGAQFDQMSDKMTKADGYPIKTVIVVEGTEGAMGEENQIPPEMRAMMGLPEKAAEEGEMMTVFSLHTEVQSIKEEAAENSLYDIPEDYQKK